VAAIWFWAKLVVWRNFLFHRTNNAPNRSRASTHWFGSSVDTKNRGVLTMRPNNALMSDTFTSPLRAQFGAAKRER
jgi:hypothetical protein